MSTGSTSHSAAEFAAYESLTRQTDYRGLCDGLIEALPVVSPGITVSLFEVYDDRGHTSWNRPDPEHLVVRHFPSLANRDQPDWLTRGIAASRDADGIVLLPHAGIDVVCLGGLNGLWRFVEIGGRPSDSERDAIQRLATIFANLMRLIDRFERDPLTGLLNRQSFEHRFADLIEYQQQNPSRDRKSDGTWLAITDIDHFKRVNDTYGHLFGDEILLLVSRIMRQSFRFDDLLFRYGGEEFVVILNNTDEAGASQALERFCAAVRAYQFPRLKQLTMSVGWVAVSPRDFLTDVIDKADKALYHAKDSGRDRVVSFDAAPDSGENP